MKLSTTLPLSLGLGADLALASATMATPAHAQSSDDLARTLVQLADVVFQNGQPYYRYNNERLVVGRDQYGRTVYYRVSQPSYYGNGYTRTGSYYSDGTRYGDGRYYERAPYQGGYYDSNPTIRCNTSGWCTRTYYDPVYDLRRR